MPFAKTMEGLCFKNPKISHRIIPIKNKISIGNDRLETSLVFQVLYTCGKNAIVVKRAAPNPIASMALNSMNTNM